MGSKPKDLVVEGTADKLAKAALADIKLIGKELSDWHGKMPEKLREGEKGSAIKAAFEAIKALPAHEEKSTGVLKVKTLMKRKIPKWMRRDNAVSVLIAAKAPATLIKAIKAIELKF